MGAGVERVALKRAGSIEVAGLTALSESHGRDFMPHPFAHTRPSEFANLDEYNAHAAEVLDRINNGDLRALKHWFASYVDADIRVECAVENPGAPRGRLVAHRRDESGYLAVQQPDADVVDVYTVSPYQLGAAIAGSMQLSGPGKNAKIVIPEFARRPEGAGDDEDTADRVAIQHRVEIRETVNVPYAEMTRYARVQSHWQPARAWGFDRGKNAVVWVRIGDDGEYIYAPGFTHLTPMTARGLARRIDELIAEDVAAVRAARGLT